MQVERHEFLRRKFMHLFKCFAHSREGFITEEDAQLHSKELASVLRRQLESEGISNEDIERRVAEFDADWMPSAMGYFGEMAKFATNRTNVSADEFLAFNMSIRDYIVQHDALPSWFEDSLRMSYVKCWSNKEHLLVEDGLELLPGITRENKTTCHHHLTENNNRKIDVSTFLSHIKDFYSIEDPKHISKYIHGYQEE